MTLKVETRDTKILTTKYRALNVKTILTHITNEYLSRMQIDLNHYPPPPPGSTYKRTGALGRGWLHRTEGAQGVVRLENAVPYATYVQGPRQAWMHVGRWATVEEVWARYHDAMTTDLRQAVREELSGEK